MIKFVILAAFVLFAVLTALATLILGIVLSEAAIDHEVVLWPSLLIYAGIVTPTAFLGRAAWREIAPVTTKQLCDILVGHEEFRLMGTFTAEALEAPASNIVMEQPRAAGLFRRNPKRALDMLAANAEARHDHNDAIRWRDFGMIAYVLGDDRDIDAFRRANEINPKDWQTFYYLQLAYKARSDFDAALRASRDGQAVAQSDQGRIMLHAGDIWSYMFKTDWAGMLRASRAVADIARTADVDQLTTVAKFARETAGIAGALARTVDYEVAKEILDANMDALRTLAARNATPTARKDLAEGLVKTGQQLADGILADYGRALIEEARAL